MLAEPPRISHRPGTPEWAKQEIESMEEIALNSIKPKEDEQWGDMENQWD
jgi:hypothetical protein